MSIDDIDEEEIDLRMEEHFKRHKKYKDIMFDDSFKEFLNVPECLDYDIEEDDFEDYDSDFEDYDNDYDFGDKEYKETVSSYNEFFTKFKNEFTFDYTVEDDKKIDYWENDKLKNINVIKDFSTSMSYKVNTQENSISDVSLFDKFSLFFSKLFSSNRRRIKKEIYNTKALLDNFDIDKNINNISLNNKLNDQLTINNVIIENIDKMKTIDLFVQNEKLKSLISTIESHMALKINSSKD